jgi:hypothetical protein
VQTVLFTNVSFSFNSFKLLPLEDKIKDFFHIQYTPSGRMSAGLSTTITITFTPQLNEDINSVFPILSETGLINIALICTCKKALVAVENPLIDFGDVIFGEQNTQFLRLNNTGALTTKIFAKAPDGRTVPFLTLDELRTREEVEVANIERAREIAEKAAEQTEEEKDEEAADAPGDNVRASHPELKPKESIQSMAAASALESQGKRHTSMTDVTIPERRSQEAVDFDEFIA